jgi:hypothetical protein
MKKDITICFRTSDDLRKPLEKIARENRRSLSAIIENALHDYLKHKGTVTSGKEKRRHPRKEVSLPAFVSLKGAEGPYPGIILDISLGGLRLSLPSDSSMEVQEDDRDARINILFTLPKEKSPVAMTVNPNRTKRINGDIEVAAHFADCDFPNYQKIQNYLLQ